MLLVANNQLLVARVVWRRRTAAIHKRGKTNLVVDLGHALLVLLRRTLASEDDVHLLETETLGLGNEEPDERRAEKGQ